MRRLVLFMHTSLDGLVAGPNGEMDWIIVDEEIFDYAGRLTDQADTALYGRVTYQMMESYWPTAADKPDASRHDIQHSRWYMGVSKVVLSTTLKGPTAANTQVVGENVASRIQALKQAPGRNIVIFGSPTAAHSLMEYNLIDEFWLFQNPLLLGVGMPLFKNIKQKMNLRLAEAKAFSCGVVGLHYEHIV